MIRQKTPRPNRPSVKAVTVVAGCVVLGLVATGLILVGLAFRGPSSDDMGQQPTAIPPRQLAIGRVGLGECWRRNGIFLPYLPEGHGLASNDSAIIYVGWEGENTTAALHAIDPETRMALWEISEAWPFHDMASSGDVIYALYSWRLHALSARDGHLLWESEDLPGHTSYQLQPGLDGGLVVISTDDSLGRWGQLLRIYDPKTGELVRKERKAADRGSFIRLMTPDLEIWSQGDDIWAVDRLTSAIRWIRTLEGQLISVIPTEGEILVALVGPLRIPVGLSAQDGSVEWEYPGPISSNIEVSGGQVYGLRQDGDLVAIEVDSGEVTTLAKFAGGMNDGFDRAIAFWVNATPQLTLVYLGDSQELFAICPLD